MRRYILAIFLKLKFLTKFIPDKIYIVLLIYLKTKKRIDLTNPKTFSDKVNYLKINPDNDLVYKLSDKLEVKEYASDNNISTPTTLWTGTKLNSEVINQLPSSFVIKTNHFSGDVIIIKDKTKMDFKKINKYFKKILSKNYYYYAREVSYKYIEPKLFIEEYLESPNKDLADYKFFCMNGKVEFCHIVENRSTNLTDFIVSKDFNNLNFNLSRRSYVKDEKPAKPNNYNKMISLAEKLSKDLAFVRVDLYEYRGEIYLGEMTFYPWGGAYEFSPKEKDSYYESELGKKIFLNIPNKKDFKRKE